MRGHNIKSTILSYRSLKKRASPHRCCLCGQAVSCFVFSLPATQQSINTQIIIKPFFFVSISQGSSIGIQCCLRALSVCCFLYSLSPMRTSIHTQSLIAFFRLKLMDADILGLPVHDSVIVPTINAAECVQIMEQSYRQFTDGFTCPVTLS